MFGKINLALGISKNNQETNNNNNSNMNKYNNNKASLVNPKFSFKKQKNFNQQQQMASTYPQKTKFIHKQTNKNFKQKQINSSKNNIKSKFINKQQKISKQMEGSKFRILNEILYSNTSQYAMEYFKDNIEDYRIYHDGYRYQAQKWQSKPVNVLIKFFRKNYKQYKDKKICDLGCGQGFLYQELTRKIYQKQNQDGKTVQAKNKHLFNSNNILSFDLVSLKPFIKVADIKNLPLPDNNIDCVVFCLSLMGKNYLQFIQQAYRILKNQTGQLFVAQVQSRSKNWKIFVQMIQSVGFQLINNGISLGTSKIQAYETNKNKNKPQNYQNTNNNNNDNNKNRYFRIMHFIKNIEQKERIKKIKYQGQNYNKDKLTELSHLLLTECIYKKR